MILWLALLAYILTTLLLAGRKRWRTEGWVHAWLYLLGTAAAFRYLIWMFPPASPALSRILIFAGFGLALSLSGCGLRKFRLRLRDLPFALIGLLVLARCAFPQYDVDSLSYHLGYIKWLLAKHELPDLQGQAEGVFHAFRVSGFEDFLGIPAADGDLALWGGLLSGWVKVLGFFTLLSVMPRRFAILGYLAAFLTFIDDHFLFSGQNKFVYLNPAIFGLGLLAYWYLWRGIRGKKGALALSMAFFLGLTFDKYHGPFFGALGVAALAGSLALPRARRWFTVREIVSWVKSPAVWIGIFGCLSLYGLNWVETGTPVYPWLANGLGGEPGGAAKQMESSYFAGTIWQLLAAHHYKLVTYAGNLALKLLVVLFFPAVFLLVASYSGIDGRLLGKRLDRRHLELAVFGFLISLGWILMCNLINHEHSRFHGRYPRFIYGVTILSIMALAASAAPLWRIFRFPMAKVAQHLAGLALLAYLVATLDTRYFNITRSERIGWADIKAYWATPGPVEPHKPHPALERVMFPFITTDAIPIADCLLSRELGVADHSSEEYVRARDALLGGKGLIVMDPRMDWPNYFFAGNALRPANNMGINPDLKHYRYLIAPKRFFSELPERVKDDSFTLKLKSLLAHAKPVCESASLEAFRVPQGS